MIGGVTERRIPRPPVPGTDRVVVRAYVTVDEHALISDRADAAGLSVSRYLWSLVERDQVDEHGRPTWAPLPAVDQLPIAS
jgi:hypothetical protein